MSKRHRRGLGNPHDEVHGEDEILGAINEAAPELEPVEDVEENEPAQTEEVAEPANDIPEEDNTDILDALNKGAEEEAPKEEASRKRLDFGDERGERPPREPREDRNVSFGDTERFGAGITMDLKNNNKTNGGNRMRSTNLESIITSKMPKVQAGRSLANFRGLNYILEPQDILKFVGESITEYNPKAKLALDRVKASTMVSTILQAAENVDEGREDRKYVMNRLALEMTGLGFDALKEMRDGYIDVIVLQLPREGYTTQGDPDNIVGGGLKKDYVKAGTIIEEFGAITPTRQVPATLFAGDDNLRLDGGIQVFTDLFKMGLICTIMLYNVFSIDDAMGMDGGKVCIEVGSKGYGTYEIMTYLNKGNVPFVK